MQDQNYHGKCHLGNSKNFPFGLPFMLHANLSSCERTLTNPYTVQQLSLSLQATFPGNGVCIFTTFELSVESSELRIDMRLSADIIIWRRVIHCAVCFLALTAPCYWAKSNFHPLSYILVKNIEFVTWCDPVTEACRTYTPSQTQFRLNRFQVGKGVSNQETCMDYFVLSGKSCDNLNLTHLAA